MEREGQIEMIRRFQKRFQNVIALVLATAAIGFYLGAASVSVNAIPNPQESCALSGINITTAQGFQAINGTAVTINNGSSGRRVIAQFSADIGVTANAEVRIGYRVDAGPVQEGLWGPANLANNQEFNEARMVIAVIPVGPGTHTIQPYWRISGAAGHQAFMNQRCFTVEGRTV
jgi:hypothetical protein